MKRDFTIIAYKTLLKAFQQEGFSFIPFAQYIEAKSQNSPLPTHPSSLTSHLSPLTSHLSPLTSHLSPLTSQNSPLIILRHDVDARPQNSLAFARIQSEMGIKGTYYFRMIPQSYNEAIIKEMVSLGHEVGYHYETMDTCNGNADKAYDEFCRNLEKFRKLTPVQTISMHGSPMSSFDNREIWEKYDYKKLGIIAEPYFDINFNELFYITDTGRRWDGHLYNVRDKATKENPVTNPEFLKLRYHSTFDLINAIKSSNIESSNPQQANKLTNQQANSFPHQAMLNFHPQRWNDKPIPWLKELLWQNVKNQGKRLLLLKRGNKDS